jgi:very-short-patch-repair endonuclease
MANEVAKRAPDALVARIAARQHGVVAIGQLHAAGLLPSVITKRVSAGRLHRIHRGVYAVGHVGLSREGRWMAGVLACGPGAVLSHRSAAALWGIAPASGVVDVTVPGNGGRAKRRGINLHRSARFQPGQCTLRDAIPVTRPARTLDDLRRVLSAKEFAAALREAEFLRLPIGDRFAPDRTRTELESRLLSLCRRHRLPKPEVNARLERFVVDFLWREQRLIVEADGWESHRTRSAFEADRARDARLKVLGYEVLRFTWRQITSDPRGVARAIRALLDQ